MWPFRSKKENIRSLKQKLEKVHGDYKNAEKRLYEAIYEDKPLARIGLGPNQRQHWQAKPLRDHARFLYDNDAIARRVVDSISCNMIGKGVIPIARSTNPLYKKKADAFLNAMLNSAIIDWDGDNNLAGMQALVVKSLVRDGSVFVRRVIKRRRFCIQILEADYLDVQRNNKEERNGNFTINGLEYNSKTGQVVAYWMWPFHPEDRFGSGVTGRPGSTPYNVEIPNPSSLSVSPLGSKSIRIPAKDMCHIKRIDRAGQQDGISWLAPVMIKIWDLREYEEAKLKQQKLQASFTAFIKDNFNLDGADRRTLIGEEEDSWAANLSVSPGHIEDLPPGKDIVFPSPTGTTDERFVERALRAIAAGLGVSYEIFNDYSLVSYSSGRMGFLEMDRHLKFVLKTIIEPQFLMPLGKWILEHLEINGIIPDESDLEVMWSPPAREMIDPATEVKALANMVGSNLMSMKQAYAILGQDFEKSMDEIAYSNEEMRKRGLSPLTSFGGNSAQEAAFFGKSGGSEEETEDNEDAEDKA